MAGMRAASGLRSGAGAVGIGLAAGIVVVSCGTTAAPRSGAPAVTTAVTTAANAQPYRLYTHCGIGEAKIGTRYFEAVHPLSDGSGNPPAGWGNPYQAGTMTLVSATEAVFADSAGHRVVFTVRPGATSFLHLCS